MLNRPCAIVASLVIASALAVGADTPSAEPRQRMTKQTRMLVIRSLNAETVYMRKALPMGIKGVTIKNGAIQPSESELAMAVTQRGPIARPGERARITNVEIKDKAILIELNGGPKKKKKWWQRIEVGVGGSGATTPIAPDDPNERMAQGTSVLLEFDDFVPEMTGDQIRAMLDPILNFHAKSATEAYLDTVPPKVKEAIRDHRVLVGMNREMVQYAKGKPTRKIRERDEIGDFEEWLYGEPPQEVQFVKFRGDEVVQLKIMKVDGEKLVKTEKEVDLNDPATLAARQKEQEQAKAPKKPAKAPTLRRPGEEAPETGAPAEYPSRIPPQGPSGQPTPPEGQPVPPGL